MEDRARQLALRRLTVREYGSNELKSYLNRKGISEEVAAATVESLCQEKWIDDQRFIRTVTRAQAGRGKGPLAVAHKLKQKGITADLNDLRTHFEESVGESEDEISRRWLERKFPEGFPSTPAGARDRARAYAGLIRRGFSAEVVSRLIREWSRK
jgi:regulatory protein